MTFTYDGAAHRQDRDGRRTPHTYVYTYDLDGQLTAVEWTAS
jgi:YD repeat-containing protein